MVPKRGYEPEKQKVSTNSAFVRNGWEPINQSFAGVYLNWQMVPSFANRLVSFKST